MRLIKLAAACGLAFLSSVAGAAAQFTPLPVIFYPFPLIPVDLVFTRVAPCRAFVTSTAMAADSERIFTVSGPSSAFAAQGGPSAGCGVPASAAAVAISFTSFGSAGSGYLRATAFGDPVVSNTQVLSFTNNVTVTAGAIASVNEGKFIVRSFSGSTKLLGDITGYFAPLMHVGVNANGTVYSKTNRLVRVEKQAAFGIYFVYFDRDHTGCIASVTAGKTMTSVAVQVFPEFISVATSSNYTNRLTDSPFQLSLSC